LMAFSLFAGLYRTLIEISDWLEEV
jgi:hypothetical protein